MVRSEKDPSRNLRWARSTTDTRASSAATPAPNENGRLQLQCLAKVVNDLSAAVLSSKRNAYLFKLYRKMSTHESEKATRYLRLLETARLSAHWSEIPELVRKINKHAPQRNCLALTAETEAQVATSGKSRPNTSSSVVSHGGLLDATPSLLQAIEREHVFSEDAFQATVCLHHIYLLRSEWKAIIGGLHEDLERQLASLGRKDSELSPCTRLAVVKSRYLLGMAYEQQGNIQVAMQIYESVLSFNNNTQRDIATSSQYRLWTERSLARACDFEMGDMRLTTLAQANRTLSLFRAWTGLLDQGPTSVSESRLPKEKSRRHIWSLFYHYLSLVLANGLVYTESQSAPLAVRDANASSSSFSAGRQRQRAEFKRVESHYETLLLQETTFPKASQINEEVEQWAEQAVRNWRIFTSSSWRESDLGEGGREAVSRNLIDILYRAATKTFHSTSILRHLFTLHAAVAEFDLAMKAFDSYTEIIGKGKARAEKTGKHEPGLDDDNTVLYTAAEAVNILCLYGTRDQAEKALDVGKRLSAWLQQKRPRSPQSVNALTDRAGEEEKISAESFASPKALAAAYMAIGQSQASWARWTYDPKQRTDLRVTALETLRRSASILEQNQVDAETAYQLAYVLAESRDVTAAIQVLKHTLASLSSPSITTNEESDLSTNSGKPSQQRSIILWHLLSLLLTAKGEYETASKTCDAALDQWYDTIADSSGMSSRSQSDDLVSNGISVQSLSRRVIEQLDDSEKDTLLQIKMTQMELLSLLEGPSVAVEKSSELLAIYARLFGDPTAKPKTLQSSVSASTLGPPKSSSGTIKNFRNSVLGRPKSMRRSLDRSTFDAPPLPDDPAQTVQPTSSDVGGQQVGTPIATSVTNEEGQQHPEKAHKHHIPHHPFKHLGHHSDTQGAENINSTQRLSNTADTISDPTTRNGENEKSTAALNQPTGQTFDSIPHNINHEKQPPPLGHGGQPPVQDLRLPAPHPASSASPMPRFSSPQQRRHSISLLVDIWLFVTSLYLKEEMFDDVRGAIDEAQKLVVSFQSDLAQQESSARAFDERGWGTGKSVSRLWADVYTQRGLLHLSLSRPHPALSAFEQALSHYPDHPAATIHLSNILLDIYSSIVPAEPSTSTPTATPVSTYSLPSVPTQTPTSTFGTQTTTRTQPDLNTAVPTRQNKISASSTATTTASTGRGSPPSPADLNRLAARDRAYMLLSSLTKLGDGWDNAEAWFVLARCYELSGQLDKSRECLWWVVELEDSRPVREWSVVRGVF